MTRRGNGRTGRTESASGVKIGYGIGLELGGRGVVAEDATSASRKSGGALSHHHVVKKKDRQGGGIDPLRSQRGDDRAFHMGLPPDDVHNPKFPATTGGGIGCTA